MLFSTRWVLQALGKEDFGLFSVVGGLIVFILFIGNTMAGGVQRFYAYTIGQEDSESVCKWFNTALSLHGFFVLILIAVGIPVGNYLLNHVMQIPESRLQTSHWIFNFSILGAVSTLISAPTIAMFTAKQKIYELSLCDFLQTILMFSLAIALLKVSGDLLLIYSLGMILIKILVDVIKNIRAYFIFSECCIKINYWFHLGRIKKLTSFVGWNLFGTLGGVARNQGLAFLINLFSGPRINAGYGVANQVAAQTGTISVAMYSAISPEITRSEGAGERERMISLSLRLSKFIVFSTFFWLFPLYFEIESVLSLWLGDVPEHTGSFCRIILLVYTIDKLTIGCTSAVHAHGNIKGFQITGGLLLILTFPLVWLGYSIGLTPVQALSFMLVTGIAHSYSRVIWLNRLTNMPMARWVRGVLLPSIYVMLPAILMVFLVDYFTKPSTCRFIFIVFFIPSLILLTSWFLGMDDSERTFIKSKYNKVLEKIKNN